jgi:archaellum component FlaC
MATNKFKELTDMLENIYKVIQILEKRIKELEDEVEDLKKD